MCVCVCVSHTHDLCERVRVCVSRITCVRGWLYVCHTHSAGCMCVTRRRRLQGTHRHTDTHRHTHTHTDTQSQQSLTHTSLTHTHKAQHAELPEPTLPSPCLPRLPLSLCLPPSPPLFVSLSLPLSLSLSLSLPLSLKRYQTIHASDGNEVAQRVHCKRCHICIERGHVPLFIPYPQVRNLPILKPPLPLPIATLPPCLILFFAQFAGIGRVLVTAPVAVGRVLVTAPVAVRGLGAAFVLV